MRYEIQSRQRADSLARSSTALSSGGVFLGPVVELSGYAELSIFAAADQPFTVELLEATDVSARDGVVSGNFVRAQAAIAATLVGALWQVCQRINPCGIYGKFLLSNGGADMTTLDFLAAGLPLP